MNFGSKFYQACPIGPCMNHPAHLGPSGSCKIDVIIIPYLTGQQAQGMMRGYKHIAHGLQSYFLIMSFQALLSFKTHKNAL